VNSRVTVRLEALDKLKKLNYLIGIESATLWLVAKRLNRLCYLLAQEKQKYSQKTCPSTILFATNPT
jgi:hypothetical protein